ncbi:hypothetical protein [Acetobacter sp.]|uniref:hypothetical protein n=1 Tax=Acetobacter sp. TaxID=440 RepID=UPI0025C494EA|nr:hypothetical protein [Acetobacter sp.]MCH4089909.1 hypothetical protein [Acetobacter sp.]MCI1298605.1 hypothetical protein [Acetobacter sp.]MCI1315170.1 hypothetical protein [Acetobacter sp.]
MPDHNTQLIDLLTVLVPRMREHGIVSCDVPLEEGQLKLELTPLQIVDVLHNVSTVESAARTVDALSPEMGIFSEAVVEEGLHITKGAILGFVDVGPLRLALDAPVSGTVLLCLVPVNSVVGYHQPVFRIQPD